MFTPDSTLTFYLSNSVLTAILNAGLRLYVSLRTSPVAIPAPSEPFFVFSRIVGIEIDVQARNSAIPKLEQVAETSAWGLAACPGFSRHFAVRSSFNHQVVAGSFATTVAASHSYSHILFPIVIKIASECDLRA
jgi:hypothetical protein